MAVQVKRGSTAAGGGAAEACVVPGRRGAVLGIDPGLERTGYAVIAAAGGGVLDAGLIKSTASKPLAERLNEIAAGLDEVLRDHTVGLFVVEDLFAHYRHPRTAILMGHARGVVLSAAARRGIEVQSVSATKIKKALTGNGHASKLQVQRAIMATLGLGRPPEPPDVADALALAWYGAWKCKADGAMMAPATATGRRMRR